MDWSPAHIAVEHEDIDTLRQLLELGLDPNERTLVGGFTLLHHAIDVEADGAIQTGQPLSSAVTRLLLEAGADPTLVDNRGKTCRQLAEEMGHDQALELLSGTGPAARPADEEAGP